MNRGLLRMPLGIKGRVSLGKQFGYTGRTAPNGPIWNNIPWWATRLELELDAIGHSAAASDAYGIRLSHSVGPLSVAATDYYSANQAVLGVVTSTSYNTTIIVAQTTGSGEGLFGSVRLAMSGSTPTQRWVVTSQLARSLGAGSYFTQGIVSMGGPNRTRLSTLQLYAPTYPITQGVAELFAYGDDI